MTNERSGQQRVLVRARNLAAFRAALVARATAGSPIDVRRRAVIVPTRASGELLRQTMEDALVGPGRSALVCPELVTRDEWLARLHDTLPDRPPMLTRIEREVILERAVRETGRTHPSATPPFEVRPGLVATMLDFYDELKRRQRGVRRFARVLFGELGGARGFDRGTESLIRQTTFFGFAFLAYERAVAASGAIDEHGLRARLIALQPVQTFDHVLVAVADHPTDPRGLWPADFDLIGRLGTLARVEIVVTDESHDAGFRERLELELPGLVEERAAGVAGGDARIVRPPARPGARARVRDADLPVLICRDREDELREVARALRAGATSRSDDASGPEREASGPESAGDGPVLAERVAIVFQRPLPYLYLAGQVLTDARVPFQAFDALPLAAEPYAALLDLVLDVARTGGTRDSVAALLRSTLLRLVVDGRPIEGADVSALDAVLVERRAAGDASTFAREVDAYFGGRPSRDGLSAARAARAARAAAEVGEALAPFRQAASASARVDALAAFLRAHERPIAARDGWAERHRRARAAVLAVLDELAAACRRHDDAVREPAALSAAIHHALEARTFSPRRGRAGVHLVDAVAARFGEFDRVHLVGLVDTDWPERMRRNMFYTPGLLKALGWPQQPDQAAADEAAFRDILGLARQTTWLSAFQFEGDAVVGLSPLLDVVGGRAVIDAPEPGEPVRLADELIALGVPLADLEEPAAGWLADRMARPPLTDRAYGGFVRPRAPMAYRVSQVDRYVECPFKYFGESVLGLREEREGRSGLTPLERGTLLHTLFERFYRAWAAEGRGAITAATLPDALEAFARVAEDAFADLAEPDRALERARLLGSLVGTGVAARVFELEADSDVQVRERLLEHELQGTFDFPALAGLVARAIAIRGKADRIDVLADGSLRVVDYKLGRMPNLDHSVQIAVYAHAARQTLEARDGRSHPIAAAMYLAFGDEWRLDGPLGDRSNAQAAVEARAAAFADAVARIEAGEFPPRPLKPSQCQWCGVAGVCRKEYRLEDEGEGGDEGGHGAVDAV